MYEIRITFEKIRIHFPKDLLHIVKPSKLCDNKRYLEALEYQIDPSHFPSNLVKFTDRTSKNLMWGNLGNNLIARTDPNSPADKNNKTVTKIGTEGHSSCNAIWNIGWSKGIHKWSFFLEGGDLSISKYLQWIVIGVSTVKDDDTAHHNSYFISGVTFGISCAQQTYGSLGVKSGSPQYITNTSKVNLILNCDLGTLEFFAEASNSPFIVLNVPKYVELFPFAHLYHPGNSVTFIE